MQKLSIKKIVEFRGKSDRSKKSFITALKLVKPKTDIDSGGDYWVSCLSAISNSYKSNNIALIIDKRSELESKISKSEYKHTKTMYKRNIDILYSYEDFALEKWRPSKKLKFIKKQKDHSILTIKGLQVQVTPNHIFTYKNGGTEEIGAIWFIAKLNGFRKEELGMFTDILHLYLRTHFSKDYSLNAKYCIAVDVFNNFEVNFSQLQKAEVPSILNSMLDEIKKIL